MDARAFARAHDAYLDPDRYFGFREIPVPRCSRCGAFLAYRAERVEPWEEALDCDGSESIFQQPYEEGTIAVLGEEYRDKTYAISVSPCGTEVGPHAPHREILWAGETRYRTCRRCGFENAEAE